MPFPDYEEFFALVQSARAALPHDSRTLAVPVWTPLLDDQLTPVLAYRRLVAPDQRTAPSFLLESVEGGERQGRHSILGAQPALEVIAHRNEVRVLDHRGKRRADQPPEVQSLSQEDPLLVPKRFSAGLRLVKPGMKRGRDLPACFLGGWAGYAAYDSVRYTEPEKLAWKNAPPDDRGLADVHFAFYDGVVVFDHVDKLVHVVRLATVPRDAEGDRLKHCYTSAAEAVETRVRQIQDGSRVMASGRLDAGADAKRAQSASASNITRQQHGEMVAKAKDYIAAGDIFQVVLGQRFERTSPADPFEVYRALRVVNPSPYMVYLQAGGCILVASSPEILCRVRRSAATGASVVTNRPLAGTRKRGVTQAEDVALEKDLLGDPKELAEHIMLVDLGRNDVGQVARPGSIETPSLMSIERYSHVMHISSTITGELREGLDCWDALRAALPVGTISGAPKIRAMQIIDELEPVRRGPYGGGMGVVGIDGDMDIALALRTMVVPVDRRGSDGAWVYHLQASGGIVADSQSEAEYAETVNKAAALERAVELAEMAFSGQQEPNSSAPSVCDGREVGTPKA